MIESENILKSLYTTVFALRFNTDGTHLAASDNFGHIALYKLRDHVFLECLFSYSKKLLFKD